MTNVVNDEIIREIIEKGLSSLGENPKEALWFHLEKSFGYDRRKVPESIEGFQQILQKLFGIGYNSLDVLFRKYLSEATGENLKGCSSFADCVADLLKKQRKESTLVTRLTETCTETCVEDEPRA